MYLVLFSWFYQYSWTNLFLPVPIVVQERAEKAERELAEKEMRARVALAKVCY